MLKVEWTDLSTDALITRVLEARGKDDKKPLKTKTVAENLMFMGHPGPFEDLVSELVQYAQLRARVGIQQRGGKKKYWTGSQWTGSTSTEESWNMHQWNLPLWK